MKSSDAGMCPQLSMLPSEYVKRNVHHLRSDEKWLPLALAEVGETHVAMATIPPFRFDVSEDSQRHPRAARYLAKQKKLILEDNALNLIRM